MVLVNVIGSGDANTMMLVERTRRVVAQAGIEAAKFEYIEVGAHDRVSGLDQLPAVLVNGQPIVQGIVPKMRELRSTLTQAIQTISATVAQDPLSGLAMVDSTTPRCTGCGRNCSLDAPGCRVGMRRAKELGIARR